MTVIEQTGLSEAERATLWAFRTAQKRAGMPPELREVADVLGQTEMNALNRLNRLVEKGRLVKVGRYRGFREVKRNGRQK